MTKTVSARIPNKTHSELIEMCNKSGCTINEWINELIQYMFTGESEFDFGDEDVDESSEIKLTQTQNKSSKNNDAILEPSVNEITQATVTLIE